MEAPKTTKQILIKLTAFSFPLILSGLLQQLFNWVDALIVGNILGETALAGVNATSALYNLFVTIIIGFTSGLSVLFAQQFGEGKSDENGKLLASYSVILSLAFTVVSILGMFFTTPILKLMETPNQLLPYAQEYLLVIFAGIPFLAVYNTFSAALRGMGNSKIPFIAVLISSAANCVLDYIFIAFFDWGVSAAAGATVVSQIIMTVYVVLYTIKKEPCLKFSLIKRQKYYESIKIGRKYGTPPAIQGSISSIGNLFLQRFMNSFGEQTVAAITTAYRVDSVLLLPIINFSTAVSTLVAQETGAGNPTTAKKIFKIGAVMISVISLVLTAIILILGKHLLSIFGLTTESIVIGKTFFRTIAVFYVIYGLSMSIKAYLEGTSDMLYSAGAGILSLGVRILCSYLFIDIWENMVIAYAEAFSWIFLLTVFTVRYFYKKSKAEAPSDKYSSIEFCQISH